MATSFRDMFITFALIGVFVLASISFIVTTQIENGANHTILEDEFINTTYIDINKSMAGLENESQVQKTNYDKDVPERGFGSLLIFAIVGAGQRFTDMVIGVYKIFIVLPSKVLNVPPAVISALTAIILISVLLLAWRVYRAGA